MSKPEKPEPAKLFASLLVQDESLAEVICDELAGKYGVLDFKSTPMPFNFTDYYAREMGDNLVRFLISFRELVSPESLPAIKLYTLELENRFARSDGSRRVNIDPGYMTLHHVILATCKRFSHRPYLREGVYADMTLMYRGKSFCPLAWTFPDYGSPQLVALLNTIRSGYHRQLRESRLEPGTRM